MHAKLGTHMPKLSLVMAVFCKYISTYGQAIQSNGKLWQNLKNYGKVIARYGKFM